MYIQNGANATISNSSIIATSNIYVQSKSSSYNPASVTINNSSITTPRLELTSGDNSINNSKALNVDQIKVGDYSRSVSLTIDGAESITSTNSIGLEANYASTTIISNVDTYSASGSIEVSGGATVNISNVNKLSVGNFTLDDSGSLSITNSNVELTTTNRSKLDEATTLTIDGGSFKASSAIDVYQGSTLTFKNTTLDLTNSLTTRTNSDYKDNPATINVENSTGNLGYVDMYGYTSEGALPVLNITNGSNVSVELSKTETTNEFVGIIDGQWVFEPVTKTTNMRGGTINVSADSTLKVNSNLIQEPDSGKQVYTSTANIKGTLIVDGDISLSEVQVEENASVSAKSIYVASNTTLISKGNLSVETLKISDMAKNVFLSENSQFEELNIISSNAELAIGDIVDMSSVFGDNLTVVMSIIEAQNVDFYITKNYNTEIEEVFKASFTDAGSILVSEIPEPSTYAAIFGALALAFVAYRKRK